MKVQPGSPPYERETIINFNEDDEFADIFTASPKVYRALLKRKFVPYHEGLVDGELRSAAFKVPKSSIVLPRPKITRQLSAAVREQLSDRAKNMSRQRVKKV